MYCPAAFREDRVHVQHDCIEAHRLGLLTSAGAGGLHADLVPFVLDRHAGPLGVLRVHLARANTYGRDLDGRDVLAVFQGPSAYVSPSWYEAKAETGRVVPTWNYVMVQAAGRARVIEDRAWLRAQLEALTRAQEGARAAPWAVGDAPADFLDTLLAGIVGIEIPIDRLEGKWKMSQNRSAADRARVASGLAAEGHERAASLVAR